MLEAGSGVAFALAGPPPPRGGAAEGAVSGCSGSPILGQADPEPYCQPISGSLRPLQGACPLGVGLTGDLGALVDRCLRPPPQLSGWLFSLGWGGADTQEEPLREHPGLLFTGLEQPQPACSWIRGLSPRRALL